jgi:hypothetical protein
MHFRVWSRLVERLPKRTIDAVLRPRARGDGHNIQLMISYIPRKASGLGVSDVVENPDRHFAAADSTRHPGRAFHQIG